MPIYVEKTSSASNMGSKPADGRIVVRSFAVRHFHDHVIAPHAHDWHQLIYASEGVMWVHTAQGDWVVPPNRAVWVPAGVEHGIEMTGKVLVQTIYLAAGISGRLAPAVLCRQCLSALAGIDPSHREAGNARPKACPRAPA